jgi:hypothetical protein
VLGVLELINARDNETGAVIAFDAELEETVNALALLAVGPLQASQRERALQAQIAELRIQIDEAKMQREVAAITENDAFRSISEKAKALRRATRKR